MKAQHRIAVLFTLLLGAVAAREVHAETVYAVVGEGISESEINSDTLRAVYMGKSTYWKSGKKAFPLMRAANTKAGKEVFKGVLKMVPTRYRHYWTEQKLSGKGTPPREVPDAPTVAKMVASRAGAMGFVTESELPQLKGIKVKFIPVK